MEANPSVVFSRESVGFAPLRDVVADVAEGRALCRITVPRGLQAVAGVPREADVHPLFPFCRSVTAFLGRLGLVPNGSLWSRSEEGVP